MLSLCHCHLWGVIIHHVTNHCASVCVSHQDWKVCRDGTAVDYWLVHHPHRCTSFNTGTMTGNLRALNIRLVISPTQNSAK